MKSFLVLAICVLACQAGPVKDPNGFTVNNKSEPIPPVTLITTEATINKDLPVKTTAIGNGDITRPATAITEKPIKNTEQHSAADMPIPPPDSNNTTLHPPTKAPTTTANPITTSTKTPTTSTVSTTTSATTTTTKTTTTNSTTPSPPPTTPSTTTPKPSPRPSSTTTEPNISTTSAPAPSNRGFDGPSFIGGIVLASGSMAIGFVAFKFYRARTELNYHTL